MLLEVKDLGISYGKRDPVVRHVTFNLEQGKILAIVGESGSGKTTVIRAMRPYFRRPGTPGRPGYRTQNP